jgi:hypothetical protein
MLHQNFFKQKIKIPPNVTTHPNDTILSAIGEKTIVAEACLTAEF